MTAFEQELIRAMDHKCPECSSDDFNAGMRETIWYQVYGQEDDEGSRIVKDWQGWGWAYDVDEPSAYAIIRCGDCDAVLWTAEAGWIPELQEIVKGE